MNNKIIKIQVSKNRFQVVRLGNNGGTALTKPLDEADVSIAYVDILDSIDEKGSIREYLLSPITNRFLLKL